MLKETLKGRGFLLPSRLVDSEKGGIGKDVLVLTDQTQQQREQDTEAVGWLTSL